MYGIFELGGNGRKSRVEAFGAYPSIEAAIASFGDKVVDVEYADSAADLAVNVKGSLVIYAVEAI